MALRCAKSLEHELEQSGMPGRAAAGAAALRCQATAPAPVAQRAKASRAGVERQAAVRAVPACCGASTVSMLAMSWEQAEEARE